MLNAFMERQSLEAGDVTPAADAETIQFDAETLRGDEKIPFFFFFTWYNSNNRKVAFG